MISLGIDIGGTNTAFGFVDESGHILAKGSVPTRPLSGGEETVGEYISRLAEGIRALHRELSETREIAGAGVGAPCANSSSGNIEGATDLPWPSPVPLRYLLEEKLGVRVEIANDANAAAAGEMAYGAARGYKNFMMITLGTGVGGAVVCDGHLLSGSRGLATELGHIPVFFPSERMCGCGRKGCLQTYCSSKGVISTALQLLKEDRPEFQDTPLRNMEDELTPKKIYEAAEQGDKLAREIFRITGEVLGQSCAHYAAFCDPDAIVLFGGVAKAGKYLLPAMRESFEKHVLHLYGHRVEILFSAMPDADVAILGAAALVHIINDKEN
ncbi:MAG: ROK family protein [Muribaculaceae bacterium]|nr:ROK family protein [Muribaculaceae bacterium]